MEHANDNGRNSGVCLHSGSAMWEPVVVFAIDAASNGLDERQMALGVAQFKLWCARSGIGVTEAAGVYRGVREPAFIMLECDFEAVNVRDIWCFHQDSIMRLTRTRGPAETGAGSRFAWLDYANGTTRELGKLRRVGAAEAARYEGSTFISEDGMGGGGYWVAGEPIKALAPAYVPSDPYGERFPWLQLVPGDVPHKFVLQLDAGRPTTLTDY